MKQALNQTEIEKIIGLDTEAKIITINNIVINFPEERQKNICTDCRKNVIGDFKEYGLMEDSGACSMCHNHSTYVINYSVVELVQNAQINVDDFYSFQNMDKKFISGQRVYPRKFLKN